MEPTNYIFYNLFLQLKDELKVELDFLQYEAFLFLFTSGDWKVHLSQSETLTAKEREREVYDALLNLCQSLWVPKQRFVLPFSKLFDNAFTELKQYLPVVKEEKLVERDENIEEEEKKEETIIIEKDEVNGKDKLEGNDPILNKEEIQESINPKEKSVETMRDFFINFENKQSEEEQSDEAEEARKSILETPFIFSDEKHFPIRSRQVIQVLEKLKNYNKRTEGTNLDVRQTIKKLAREKVLVKPVYEKIKKGQQHIILIIEQEGAMVPFRFWASQLAQDIQESSDEITLDVLYFSKYPLPIQDKTMSDFILYTSPSQLMSIRLSHLIKSIDKHTDILFFSDAGAISGQVNSDRIQNTMKVLEQFKKYTKGILWLNPLPKEKWADTSAAFISLFVSMVPYTYEGIEKGLKEILE